MIIELQFRDSSRPSEFREIAKTELTAPTVIEDKKGNFFIKCPVDSRIMNVGTRDCPLQYRQCRGEHLSSIEIVRTPKSEEVLT